MPLIIPANTLSTGAFSVDNSCRFNRGDSPDLAKSIGSNGSLVAWTYNVWVKIGVLGFAPLLWNYHSSGSQKLTWNSDGTIHFYNMRAGESPQEPELITSAKYRDPSAWYNIHAVWDSANGTAGDRARLYVNGTRVTAFGTASNPQEDSEGGMLNYDTGATEINIGTKPYGSAAFWDGYMASAILCDGQTYEPTKFGEFDEDSPTIWKPIDPAEQSLTFGTHGFWLDFQASDNLGNDANGGTDFTETNIAAVDQCTDTPTNNFCTLNPLDNYWQSHTFSEGNTEVLTHSGNYSFSTGTIGLTAGLWYWEIEYHATSAAVNADIGITASLATSATNYLGQSTDAVGYSSRMGEYRKADSDSSGYGDTYAAGDIIGVALDLTNSKLYFAKNGTWQNSGDPTSGATGTGAIALTAVGSTANGVYFPAVGDDSGDKTSTLRCIFGGSYADTLSSAVADANGYGAFEYAPPSGYLAICTKNLGSDGG